ncbi:hypothetical protein HY994_06730 [Candidatus Micrarchaeota archaeon]|nr:hypothetical protein [Candidatus Micrarchaeota archaeon]
MPSERLIRIHLIPLRTLHEAFHAQPGSPYQDRLRFPLDSAWHPDLTNAFRSNKKAQKTTVVYPQRGNAGFRIRVAHGEGWLVLPEYLELHLVAESSFSGHLAQHLGSEQLAQLKGD